MRVEGRKERKGLVASDDKTFRESDSHSGIKYFPIIREKCRKTI